MPGVAGEVACHPLNYRPAAQVDSECAVGGNFSAA